MWTGVHIRRHMMSNYPITGDVNSDHLVKVLSFRLLHCTVATFPFIINRCRVERYSETI